MPNNAYSEYTEIPQYTEITLCPFKSEVDAIHRISRKLALPLPLPGALIAWLKNTGHTVDLITHEITREPEGDNRPFRLNVEILPEDIAKSKEAIAEGKDDSWHDPICFAIQRLLPNADDIYTDVEVDVTGDSVIDGSVLMNYDDQRLYAYPPFRLIEYIMQREDTTEDEVITPIKFTLLFYPFIDEE